jgi:hypothetical protein
MHLICLIKRTDVTPTAESKPSPGPGRPVGPPLLQKMKTTISSSPLTTLSVPPLHRELVMSPIAAGDDERAPHLRRCRRRRARPSPPAPASSSCPPPLPACGDENMTSVAFHEVNQVGLEPLRACLVSGDPGGIPAFSLAERTTGRIARGQPTLAFGCTQGEQTQPIPRPSPGECSPPR